MRRQIVRTSDGSVKISYGSKGSVSSLRSTDIVSDLRERVETDVDDTTVYADEILLERRALANLIDNA